MADYSDKVAELKKINEERNVAVIELKQRHKLAVEIHEDTLAELEDLKIKEEDLDTVVSELEEKVKSSIIEINKKLGLDDD